MANIIYGTIKEAIENDLARISIRSYGYYNTLNFDNRDELKIKFSNIKENCIIESLINACLEIEISEDQNNSTDVLIGVGKVIRVIASETFYL